MRRWIAGVLVKDTVATDLPAQDVDKELGIGPSSRGVVICAIDCKLSSCWRRMYNDVIIKRRISAVSKERNPCALVVMDMMQ